MNTTQALADHDQAARTLWEAQHDGISTPEQIAVLQAVYDIAESQYMICFHSDKIKSATARHTAAIDALVKSPPPGPRPLRCLGMEALSRFIEQNDPLAPEAKAEWTARYGHEYPVYSRAGGLEQKITP